MMIKRIYGLAAVRRAMEAITPLSSAGNSVSQRLVQAALYSNECNFSAKHRWFSGHSLADQLEKPTHFSDPGLGGTMFFSSSASATASSEARVKEPQQSREYFPKDVVLYQYEACPFCNKVKAFLDYYDIPYKVVEVNPISKKEIKWSDYRKVPILLVDGEQMVDSSDIINKLFKRIHPKIPACSDAGGEEDEKWRLWVDNHLVHVLSPNIYRTTSEALESFDYITSQGNFTFTEKIVAKYAGAAAMYFVSKKLKKKHNITDERAALYEAAETWVDALKGRKFLGGSRPNLSDLSVFGVLRPIRNLKSGKDMVDNTRVGEWYSRMERTVGASSRINQ